MSTTGPAVRLGHAALITPDLERARRFYEDVVGLRAVLVEYPDGAAYRRRAVLTDTAGASGALVLLEVPGYESGAADDLVGRRGRLDHLGLAVDHDEFDALVARLVDAGASSGRIDAVGPTRSVLFVDPDGGHHHALTDNPDWRPAPSTDVIDADLLARVFGHPGLSPSPTSVSSPDHIHRESIASP